MKVAELLTGVPVAELLLERKLRSRPKKAAKVQVVAGVRTTTGARVAAEARAVAGVRTVVVTELLGAWRSVAAEEQL